MFLSVLADISLRQRLYGSGCNQNRNILGKDRPRNPTGLFETVPFGTPDRLRLGLLSNKVPIGTVLVFPHRAKNFA